MKGKLSFFTLSHIRNCEGKTYLIWKLSNVSDIGTYLKYLFFYTSHKTVAKIFQRKNFISTTSQIGHTYKNKCLCVTHVLLLGIFHYISYIILGNLSLVPQGAFSYQNIVMEYNYCIELIFLIKRKQETKHFLATYQWDGGRLFIKDTLIFKRSVTWYYRINYYTREKLAWHCSHHMWKRN